MMCFLIFQRDNKPLLFRGGVGVGALRNHRARLIAPTPGPSPEEEGR